MIRNFIGLRSGVRTVVNGPIRAMSSSATGEELPGPSGGAHFSDEPLIVEASKKNIDQSPWKMNFFVKLVRGRWYPDAMAQLKFSPKGKAGEVAAVLQRAQKIANIYHDAIPEELIVKEIFTNKGFMQKKMRIMGRGRTGIGYHRKTHLRVKLEKINFDKIIAEQNTKGQKNLWAKRQEMVKEKKRGNAASSEVTEEKEATAE